MLFFIKKNDLESVFPNLLIVFRMYLPTVLTNCSGERSFSVLKRIKNYLRFTTSAERLNSLLLNIESELLNEISFINIIKEFFECKARKRQFVCIKKYHNMPYNL